MERDVSVTVANNAVPVIVRRKLQSVVNEVLRSLRSVALCTLEVVGLLGFSGRRALLGEVKCVQVPV